jgi:hypothetical protein
VSTSEKTLAKPTGPVPEKIPELARPKFGCGIDPQPIRPDFQVVVPRQTLQFQAKSLPEKIPEALLGGRLDVQDIRKALQNLARALPEKIPEALHVGITAVVGIYRRELKRLMFKCLTGVPLGLVRYIGECMAVVRKQVWQQE